MTKVLSSITAIDRVRRKPSRPAKPAFSLRPTVHVNTASAAVTGVPSPQVASGWMRHVTATPVPPSARVSRSASPFSIVGKRTHSMHTRVQSWS